MTAPKSVPFSAEELERFRAYHTVNLAWGSLHVVLDDGNVGDSSVEFCIRYAEERGDTEGASLGRVLLGKSKSQRLKLADGGYRTAQLDPRRRYG